MPSETRNRASPAIGAPPEGAVAVVVAVAVGAAAAVWGLRQLVTRF